MFLDRRFVFKGRKPCFMMGATCFKGRNLAFRRKLPLKSLIVCLDFGFMAKWKKLQKFTS